MQVNLCIDWGNTRVKAGSFQDSRLIEEYVFSGEEAADGLLGLIRQVKPDHVLLCSVVNRDEAWEALIAAETKLLVLDERTPLPIINAYRTASTLGMDRLALAAGAHVLFPENDNLIISAGTAITYNFVQRSGIFRGGNITPGMQLRFRALHDYTEKLPLVSANGDRVLLGYDTETSIRSGVLWGIAAEIDGIADFYRTQYPDVKVVLTGGDAALFADKLKNRIFADSNFLLKGLNAILNYNIR